MCDNECMEKQRWTVQDRGYETPCWVWSGAAFRTGYGAINRDGKAQRAHRWVYEQMRGPIPEGLHLDHLCRVKLCVNPDHLEPVTKAENERRYYAVAPKVTHCPRGHDKAGRRSCKTCDDIAKRAYKQRKRQERQDWIAENPPPPKPERVFLSSEEKRAKQSASHLLIPKAPCPDCGLMYKAGGALARHRQCAHPTT